MKRLPFENTYALLAIFLAPAKSEETLDALKRAIVNNAFELGPLLLQANIQMCTPLWYSRLVQDNLLKYFPDDFQEYLQALYDANAERNAELKSGLEKLLAVFEENEVETVLIKGSATFVDDLYDSPGARYMSDIDILVKKNKVKVAESILEKLQYIEVPDEGRIFDNKPTSERHHHINSRIKPGTPLAIEIHFTPAYAQGGRIVTNENVWKNKENVILEGYKTAIMDPDQRILLNTSHALLPDREFLYGEISLQQLSEFALLAVSFKNEIDWSKWYKIALDNNLKSEFITYLTLAHYLMEVPWPNAIPKLIKKGFHYQRIINKGGSLSRVYETEETAKEKRIRIKAKIYFWRKFPGWAWNNTFYAPRFRDFPGRVYLLIKKLFSAKSRNKI